MHLRLFMHDHPSLGHRQHISGSGMCAITPVFPRSPLHLEYRGPTLGRLQLTSTGGGMNFLSLAHDVIHMGAAKDCFSWAFSGSLRLLLSPLYHPFRVPAVPTTPALG